MPLILQWDENFDIGSDTGTPVDDQDYQVPFRFTGKLDKLTLKIDRPKLTPEDEKTADGRAAQQSHERMSEPRRGGMGWVSMPTRRRAQARRQSHGFMRGSRTLTLRVNASRLAAPTRLAFPLPAPQIDRARMFFTRAADNGFGAMSRRDRFDSGD